MLSVLGVPRQARVLGPRGELDAVLVALSLLLMAVMHVTLILLQALKGRLGPDEERGTDHRAQVPQHRVSDVEAGEPAADLGSAGCCR